MDEAPPTFGADSINENETPTRIINPGEPYTDWVDVPSPLPADFDVRLQPPLIPVEIQEMMAAVAVPYDPKSEEWQNAIVRWADPYNSLLEITLPKPYLKISESELNDLVLPNKEFYTTGDLCRLLDLDSDTFRYRLRYRIYPKSENRAGDKLAHNVRHPKTRKPVAKIIHNFGRADKLEREELVRLCRSIARVCGLVVTDPLNTDDDQPKPEAQTAL